MVMLFWSSQPRGEVGRTGVLGPEGPISHYTSLPPGYSARGPNFPQIHRSLLMLYSLTLSRLSWLRKSFSYFRIQRQSLQGSSKNIPPPSIQINFFFLWIQPHWTLDEYTGLHNPGFPSPPANKGHQFSKVASIPLLIPS